MDRRLVTLLLVGWAAVGWASMASGDPGTSTRAPSQGSSVFDRYCDQQNANEWLCERRLTIPASQKWEIVESYCLDRVGILGRVGWDERKKTADDPGPGEATGDQSRGPAASVCDEHARMPIPLALEFDHRTGRWRGSNKGFEAQRRPLDIDRVSGVPTAHLAPGDEVGIIIVGTNPLVYAANRGEAREENIEQVKALEQLLLLLSGAFKVLAAEASESRLFILFSDRARGVVRDERPDTRGTPADEAFKRDLLVLAEQLKAIGGGLSGISSRLRALVDHRLEVQAVAQRLEFGPAVFRRKPDDSLGDIEAWRNDFEKLREFDAALPKLGACEQIFDSFVTVVTTDPSRTVDVHAAAVRFLQLHPAAGGQTEPKDVSCLLAGYWPLLRTRAGTIADHASRAAADPNAVEEASKKKYSDLLRTEQASARNEHLEHVLILLRLTKGLTAARQDLTNAITKEEETRRAAANLRLMMERVRWASTRKLAGGQLVVTDRIYVQEERFDSAPTKIRVTPLRISMNSPYADQVPTSRPKETTTSYRLVRKGMDRWSFGVGLVYTRVSSPVYAAFDPDPSVNTTRAVTVTEQQGGPQPVPVNTTTTTTAFPELKVIRIKNREPRAGGFGTFANYRLVQRRSWELAGQGGVALSGEFPAFYYGLALKRGSLLTLGGGCGAFRIRSLDIGPDGRRQEPGDRVVSGDEIRTSTTWNTDCFKDAYYLSLSVNLSGLPLFK